MIGLFTSALLDEPYLEFRDHTAHRAPRRGILNSGPFDYATIPELNVALLVDQSLTSKLDTFWNLVENGESVSKYRGFRNTFGSKLNIAKRSYYQRTQRVTLWLAEAVVDLPPRTVIVICLPDEELRKNYLELKSTALSNGHRAQFILESTLSKPSPGFIALGLATGIYAKAGGTPWRLKDPLISTGLILGISFARSKENREIYYGVVDVFDKFGKLIEVKAEAFKLELETGGLYVPERSLSEYLTNLKNRLNPKYFIVHKSGSFHKQERSAISSSQIPSTLVHIEESNPYRFYDNDDSDMAVFRGLLIRDLERSDRALLMTTGNVNDSIVQRHRLGTPRPIEIIIESNDLRMEMTQIADQILRLTKLDWNSLHTEVREPISLKYARRAARLATVKPSMRVYDIRDLM